MTRLQPARSHARQTLSPAAEAARLELLEYFLIHHDDLQRSAQASLEWLHRHTGVKRSICLLADRDSGTLIGVAGVGVPTDDVEMFASSLSDEGSLVSCLGCDLQVWVPPPQRAEDRRALPVACPKCGRKNRATLEQCQYCSARLKM